jgi:YD repeat-containing protein
MDVSNNSRFFYFVGRSGDGSEEIGNTIWSDTSGNVGSKTITFTTGNKENYYIYWGIHGGGALSLDDIVVKQLQTYEYDSNGRLMKRRLQDNTIIKYYYDANGNLLKTVTE